MSDIIITYQPDAEAYRLATRKRLADKMRAVRAGDRTDADAYTVYHTLDQLLSVVTPRRLELARHLHQHPAASINALSTALGRHYRPVHEDVKILLHAGVVVRDEETDHLTCPYERVRVDISLSMESTVAA